MLLPLLSFIADIIAIVTVYISVQDDGKIGPSPAVIVLAIVNTSVIIIAYRAIMESHKYFDQYKNIDHEIEDKDEEINDLKTKLASKADDDIKVTRIFHNFCHEYRAKLAIISNCTAGLSGADYLKIRAKFQKFLLFSLSNIKEAFDILTHDECSVCIKLIINDNEVKTYARDPVSYRERHDADLKLTTFPIRGNTAFDNITNPCHPDSTYISNDLSKEAIYINKNPNWNKCYNACIVVPIRILNSNASVPEYRIIGFLCVDNLRGGFDRQICLNILASFGDLYYNLFEAFGTLEEPKLV